MVDKKLLNREFKKKDNLIVVTEKTEKTINKDDIFNEMRLISLKEEKLNRMMMKLKDQLKTLNDEKELLNSILKEGELTE